MYILALKGTNIKKSVISLVDNADDLVNNPDALKDYLNEAFADFKNVKVSKPVQETDVKRKPADREKPVKVEEVEEEEVDEEEREGEDVSTEDNAKPTDKGEPVKIVAPEPVTDVPPQFDE